MAITFYKMIKWTKMLFGKSPYHVLQGEGKVYSKTQIEGYYNNLTEKVTRFGCEDDTIPMVKAEDGTDIYFSIATFQYGLGAYDLYLQSKNEAMLKKVIACANWAVEQQKEDGSWETFSHLNPEAPFSAMAQGEGISLLCRAYLQTKDARYLEAVKKALPFMLRDVKDGGTAGYEAGKTILYEYTFQAPVLNGWIFALWGIWDYCKLFPEELPVRQVLENSVQTMKEMLPMYDNGYWSLYRPDGYIASPFYHRLHIAQLRVMAELFEAPVFAEYADRWEAFRKKPINAARAFCYKAIQKVLER